MINLEELNPAQQQLECAACQIMRDEQIGVDHGEPVDKRVDHLPLLREVLNVLAVLDLLLEIERHRLPVEFPHERQRLELFLDLRGSILAHVRMDHQGNHCDLVGVLLRATGLERETDT